MEISKLLSEESTLEELSVLLENDFGVNVNDLQLVWKVGEGQRQRSGNHFDNSAEATVFLSYLYCQLKSSGLPEPVIDAFRKSLKAYQLYEITCEKDPEVDKAKKAKVLEPLQGLKTDGVLEDFRHIFDRCKNYFCSLTDQVHGVYGSEKGAMIRQHINRAWRRPSRLYGQLHF